MVSGMLTVNCLLKDRGCGEPTFANPPEMTGVVLFSCE
jgi:hypothetical protein